MGRGHIAIAEGKIKFGRLQVYHGKVGRGLSVEMSVKHGPVTLLSVVQTAEESKVAHGGGRIASLDPSWKSETRTAATVFRSGRATS